MSRIERVDQTIEVQHDAVGRVSEVRDAASANSYRYDAVDRLIEARSNTLAYGYDSLDRMTTRTLSGTGIASPETTSYRWDGADRLLSHTTNIGVSPHTTNYEYDAAARLAARHVQAGDSGKLTQRYGYDHAERLAQIKYIRNEGLPGEQLIEQIDYSYDAKGQRIRKTTLNGHGTGKQDTPMQATYDAANRMQTITLSLEGQSKSYQLTHDANGNLTTKQNTADASDRTIYSWDSNNRLIGIQQPGLTASFLYDAYGRRIQSSITKGGQTSTVQYLYEGQQALGEIRDQKLSHRLLTGLSLDETIARLAVGSSGKDAAMSRLYMTDALNSVIAQMKDEDNAGLANSYAYSPYGQSSTLGVDATGNPIQYTSRENDGTGLIYYRNRFRDPVGGWTSDDPSGFAGGINVRGIMEGDPINLMDPLGLWTIGDPLPQPLVDFTAGVGDSLTLGLTNWLRNEIDINDTVNQCSDSYKMGGYVGYGLGVGLGGVGVARSGGWVFSIDRYANAGGGGFNVLQNGVRRFGLDWHKFKLNGQMVRRMHYHRGATKSQMKKHRPWQGGF